MLALEDEALVGHVLGDRYRVRSVVGAGTTGTVFAVEHVVLGRTFAMKVLRPRNAPLESLTNVFEADTPPAFRLAHPALCHVVDVGTALDGAPYFVTEFLEGETLAARLDRERLSIPAAIEIALQLLSVMAHVHEHRLLLRDPRPQNLFLASCRGWRPVLKVLDFGLARLAPTDRAEASWKAPDLFIAAHYFSPERTRGELGAEVASDLFVAAAILYEAIAGARPFTALTVPALLDEIAGGNPVPLHQIRRDVPRALSDFVTRGLAPMPRNRFRSADAMLEELQAILDGFQASSVRRASQTMLAAPGLPRFNADDEDEKSTAANRAGPTVLDEASASNDDRTVPPPPSELVPMLPDLTTRMTTGEEETRRKELSPELRALASDVKPPRPSPKLAKK